MEGCVQEPAVQRYAQRRQDRRLRLQRDYPKLNSLPASRPPHPCSGNRFSLVLPTFPTLVVKAIVPVSIKLVTPISAMLIKVRPIRPPIADRLNRNPGTTDPHAHVRACLGGDAGTHTCNHKSSAQCNG